MLRRTFTISVWFIWQHPRLPRQRRVHKKLISCIVGNTTEEQLHIRLQRSQIYSRSFNKKSHSSVFFFHQVLSNWNRTFEQCSALVLAVNVEIILRGKLLLTCLHPVTLISQQTPV